MGRKESNQADKNIYYHLIYFCFPMSEFLCVSFMYFGFNAKMINNPIHVYLINFYNIFEMPARLRSTNFVFQLKWLEWCSSPLEEVGDYEMCYKGKIHTFFKCIYYRAYSMVGIIIHFFVCEIPSISL